MGDCFPHGPKDWKAPIEDFVGTAHHDSQRSFHCPLGAAAYWGIEHFTSQGGQVFPKLHGGEGRYRAHINHQGAGLQAANDAGLPEQHILNSGRVATP